MRIEVTRVFDITVLRLEGQFTKEIDLGVQLDPLKKKNALKVLINFENVEYINSSCFRSLARLHQVVVGNGGEMRLCSIRSDVLNIFSVANLDRGYHIYSDEDEGVISFYNSFPAKRSIPMEIIYSG